MIAADVVRLCLYFSNETLVTNTGCVNFMVGRLVKATQVVNVKWRTR